MSSGQAFCKAAHLNLQVLSQSYKHIADISNKEKGSVSRGRDHFTSERSALVQQPFGSPMIGHRFFLAAIFAGLILSVLSNFCLRSSRKTFNDLTCKRVHKRRRYYGSMRFPSPSNYV